MFLRRSLVFLLAFLLLGFSKNGEADLLIYHLDVGMGDATLIVDTDEKEGKTLLVDSGNRRYGTYVVSPTLKSLGITKIDYFVATHYDADHIGGFDEIVDAGITVLGKVYDRGNYTNRKEKTRLGNTTQYGEYLQAARSINRREEFELNCHQPVTPKKLIQLGPKTVVTGLAVKGHYLAADCEVKNKRVNKKKDNDLSIALVIDHGDFRYFIGGDLTGGGNGTTDMESLVAPYVGDVDVLKLNHHGSATSSNSTFLSILRPEVAVISVGNGGVNKTYGLPKQKVLDRLTALAQPPDVFLTNAGEGGELKDQVVVNGNIMIHSNGSGYSVNGKVYPVDENLSE